MQLIFVPQYIFHILVSKDNMSKDILGDFSEFLTMHRNIIFYHHTKLYWSFKFTHYFSNLPNRL